MNEPQTSRRFFLRAAGFGVGVSVVLVACALTILWLARQPAKASDRSVVFFSQAQVDSALAEPAPPEHEYRMLGTEPQYQYMVVTRSEAGEPELHANWDDVVIIRSGECELRTGRRLSGQRLTLPNNWRGGTIRDPEVRTLRAGDIVVIPAGVAHQFIPIGPTPLTYWAIKGRAANARFDNGL